MRKKKEKSYYYDLEQDIKNYPDAVFIFVIGGRGTGKTYSTLKYLYKNRIIFTFIKRTMDDIKLLCTGNKLGVKKEDDSPVIDCSPFKPLNRDFNTNVRAFQTYQSLGAFYNCDSKNNPVGNPVGYIAALSGISKVKGFDLSDSDVLFFDEYIPKIYDRNTANEDVQILDMYKTISRDREHRGKAPLKFIAMANSDNIDSPLANAFNLVNELATMVQNNQEYYYNPDTRVLIHKLKTSDEFIEKESQSPIYKATAGSKWARMALENDFAFNDFSQIKKVNLKNMICEAKVFYNNKIHFVYYSPESAARYVTYSNYNKDPMIEFNLDKKTHIKKFCTYAENKVLQIYYGCDEPYFEKYDLYSLYINCRKKLL